MMDRLVSSSNLDDWKLTTFGQRIENGNTYAAALVSINKLTHFKRFTYYNLSQLLIVLKLILGLDDVTEYKVSDFAEQVNDLLKLKPSSSFARKRSNDLTRRPLTTEMDTLFVWREWVRFIEFRRLSIERTHVPTAIRKGLVHKMDPAYVLHHAQHDGKLHMNKPYSLNKVTKGTILEERVENILEQFAARLPGASTPRVPKFRPSIYGNHGIAEQLVEFDQSKYGNLKQKFSKSMIRFAICPELVDEALSKVDLPHKVKVCLGPAYQNAHITSPFFASNATLNRHTRALDRHAVKPVPLKPQVVPADGNIDDDDDVSSQPSPTLMLYMPSSGYWSRTTQLKPSPSTLPDEDWSLLSLELPSTFVWMLNLMSDSIEESPKDIYVKVSQLETIILLRHADLLHTLTDAAALKSRLVNALRKQL